jgi:hypothetical protein
VPAKLKGYVCHYALRRYILNIIKISIGDIMKVSAKFPSMVVVDDFCDVCGVSTKKDIF